MAGQHLDRGLALRLARFADDDQGGETEESMPIKPERNAARSLPARVARSVSKNRNEPVTAHSPGSAARAKTKVSEGSSRRVRGSLPALTAAPCRWPDRARTA
ncbi:hypothetical protein GCM10025880_31390 [Methylorubrum aminovorans]|nr:hypothetical protein GCM10025880_31390 [Methylorubrum aminovorans]